MKSIYSGQALESLCFIHIRADTYKAIRIMLFLFVAITGQAIKGYSQHLHADEMLTIMECSKFSCVDDYVKKHEYSFKKTKQTSDDTTFFYHSDKKVLVDSVAISTVLVTKYKRGLLVQIGYATTSESSFKELNTAFKDFGFELEENGMALSDLKKDKVIMFLASKAHPELGLIIKIEKQNNDIRSWITYSFDIRKINLL